MALSGVLDQFKNTFNKFSPIQKVSILVATVAVFVTVVSLVVWANKPVYKTLYSDLPESDVRDITTALDGKRVPYKLLDGSTISVPSDDVYATRISLALEGLPADKGVGFELFDEQKLGVTEFQQNVQYQRALQGELSRSISTLNEVLEAKVHLSIPKDRLFVTEAEEAKASVVVRLLPGRSLRPDQVKAISHLVASSVRNLNPEGVQILDTNGNLLSDFLTESQDALYATQTQLEQQGKIEKELEKKLHNLLSRALGSQNYVAKVSIEMDYTKKEITREEYGDTPVLRSQHTLDIETNSKGSGPEGIPGVESNLAEPDLLIDGILSEYSKSEETQNYEISKTVTRELLGGGSVKRLTVSVVIDDKSETTIVDGVKTVNKVSRSEEDISKIKVAVASAVGYNEARGDVVDVTNISFDTSAETAEIEGIEKEQLMSWVSVAVKYVMALIILLVFYFLMLRPILRRIDMAKSQDTVQIGETAYDAEFATIDAIVGDGVGFPKTIEELEFEIESELKENMAVDVDTMKSKVMLKKIEEASENEPEMVANLIKAILRNG